MLTRAKVFEEIVSRLSILRYAIGSQSKQGLLSVNKQAEAFYQQLLNLVLDKDLQVLDRLVKNHPAIDLGDAKSRLCVQVTSDNSSKKIKDTLTAFETHKLDKDYDRLVIFILTTKKAYTASFPKAGILKFDRDDIWDVDDLLRTIEALDTPKMQKVQTLLNTEMAPLVQMIAPDSLLAKLAPVPSSPPKNGLALREGSGWVGEPDWPKEFKSIVAFYKKYAKLARKTREWIYVVAVFGDIERDMIVCAVAVIDSHFESNDTSGLYTAAERAGFADYDVADDGYTPAVRLLGYLHSDFSMFTWLREFCTTGKGRKAAVDEDKLHTLLVDCDFTLLDN